jgi:hypothetical protein
MRVIHRRVVHSVIATGHSGRLAPTCENITKIRANVKPVHVRTPAVRRAADLDLQQARVTQIRHMTAHRALAHRRLLRKDCLRRPAVAVVIGSVGQCQQHQLLLRRKRHFERPRNRQHAHRPTASLDDTAGRQ